MTDNHRRTGHVCAGGKGNGWANCGPTTQAVALPTHAQNQGACMDTRPPGICMKARQNATLGRRGAIAVSSHPNGLVSGYLTAAWHHELAMRAVPRCTRIVSSRDRP
jgi:hypothetical protein